MTRAKMISISTADSVQEENTDTAQAAVLF